MFYLYIDYGLDTEELVWSGESHAVGNQKFNVEKNSAEDGDFDSLTLFRKTDSGELHQERTFCFPSARKS